MHSGFNLPHMRPSGPKYLPDRSLRHNDASSPKVIHRLSRLRTLRALRRGGPRLCGLAGG